MTLIIKAFYIKQHKSASCFRRNLYFFVKQSNNTYTIEVKARVTGKKNPDVLHLCSR